MTIEEPRIYMATLSQIISGQTKEQSFANEIVKKLQTTPVKLLVSQDLFSSCVPNKEVSPNSVSSDNVDMEAVSDKDDLFVPTMDADEMEVDDHLDTSIIKSPETPEPGMVLNEDSMGFDNLQALNIVTPYIDSTQSFMSLLQRDVSPIKRKCFRMSPEPLNSTQGYFDLSKHYKLLSNERKKVLYGDPDSLENKASACYSNSKPLRRKLFTENEGIEEQKQIVKDDFELEDFDKEWEKVTILKPTCQKQAKQRSSNISKQNIESKITIDPYQTPANRQNVLLADDTPYADLCDSTVPAMVVEETVETVSAQTGLKELHLPAEQEVGGDKESNIIPNVETAPESDICYVGDSVTLLVDGRPVEVSQNDSAEPAGFIEVKTVKTEITTKDVVVTKPVDNKFIETKNEARINVSEFTSDTEKLTDNPEKEVLHIDPVKLKEGRVSLKAINLCKSIKSCKPIPKPLIDSSRQNIRFEMIYLTFYRNDY